MLGVVEVLGIAKKYVMNNNGEIPTAVSTTTTTTTTTIKPSQEGDKDGVAKI